MKKSEKAMVCQIRRRHICTIMIAIMAMIVFNIWFNSVETIAAETTDIVTFSRQKFTESTYSLKIIEIHFVSKKDLRGNVLTEINKQSGQDISVKQDGSVKVFLIDTNKAYVVSMNNKTMQPDTCAYMFSDYMRLLKIDFTNFYTGNVTSMKYMFRRCYDITSIDVSKFDTRNVTDMQYMFADCESLNFLNLSNFNTKKVTYMQYMFMGCTHLKDVNVSSFNTRNVTDMRYMFEGCGLTSIDVSNFDTSKVTDMASMFASCGNLRHLDVSNFDTSKVTNMSVMFGSCRNLAELDVSNFDTSKVTNMGGMFRNIYEIRELDLSNFNTSKSENKADSESKEQSVKMNKDKTDSTEAGSNNLNSDKIEVVEVDMSKPYEDMTVTELQNVILGKLASNGPVTDQMKKDVAENIYHDSLVNWAKSFR